VQPAGALVTQLPIRGLVPDIGSGVESLSACLEIPHVPLNDLPAEVDRLAELDFVVVEGVPANDLAFAELSARPRRALLVYWVEGRLGGLSGIGPADSRAQARAIAAADLVAVVNEQTIPYYMLLAKGPVVWWGLPYYEHVTRSLARPPGERDAGLAAIGAPPTATAKNGLISALVAARSGLRALTFGTPQDGDDLAAAGVDATVVPVTDSIDSARIIAQAHVGVHLDPRDTWGRFALDCAAVGIPCVGSNRAETQRQLFPELTVDWLDCDLATTLVGRLGADSAFYERCVAHALAELPVFGFAAARARIMATLAVPAHEVSPQPGGMT
jgi:hypothetical protein